MNIEDFHFQELFADSVVMRSILTVLVFLCMLFIRSIIQKQLTRLSIVHSYEPHRLFLIRKTFTVAIWLMFFILVLTIWGLDLENVWIYFGGFISVIAVGFFAVWSILSNIVAGIFIFILNPFGVGSKLNFFDPDISAKVKNINLMFTELEDAEGIFSVPNNMFFQKVYKVLK